MKMTELKRDEQEVNKIENEFQGFSTFDEVEDVTLKAFNRCAMMFNILEVHGFELAERYAEAIEEEGRFHMFIMYSYVKECGLDTVKREISRGELSIKSEEEVAMNEAATATIN